MTAITGFEFLTTQLMPVYYPFPVRDMDTPTVE